VTHPLTTFAPPVRALLERAVDAARGLSVDRSAALHRIALCAVQSGEDDLVSAILDQMDSPSHRAHLRASQARMADRSGALERAREHAQAAALALDGAGRWRPVLPDWVGPDSARADLCTLMVTLGDDRGAAAVARSLRPGTTLHAVTVAALAHLLPAADGWDMVADAVAAIPSPAERGRAAQSILTTGTPRPRLGPDAASALVLIDAVSRGPRDEGVDPEMVLASARVAARLARVLLDVPALTAAVDAWARAVALAHQLPDDHPGGVAVLCDVARDQIQRVGPGPSTVTWQGLLERLRASPLPPDPPQRGPWADVLALGLRHPALAAPLTRVVARHPAVPSAWAHALGLLHIRAGRPERAVRVAEVLAEAAARHAEDHESLLLSGLLRARAGEPEEAWDDLLGAVGTDTVRMAWLAGSDGPLRYEHWAVVALLDGGSVDLALLLARLTAGPLARARLLATCLRRMPAGEGAAALAEEVAAAVDEVVAQGGGVPVDAQLAQLPRVLWESGEVERAEAVLGQLVGGLIEVSVPAWVDGLTHLHAMLDAVGPASEQFAAPLVDGWVRRLDSAEPEDAVALLLGWLGIVGRSAP